MSTAPEDLDGIQLQLGQIIYGRSSKVCINIVNGQLKVLSEIPVPKEKPIIIQQAMGGTNLARHFRRKMPVYERVITPDPTARHGRRTDNVKVGETTGFASIARQLSIIKQVDEGTIRALLIPMLKLGMGRIFLFSTCGKYGLKCCEENHERFDIDCKWEANGSHAEGSPQDRNYRFIQKQLQARGSPWRIQTSDLFVSRVMNPDLR